VLVKFWTSRAEFLNLKIHKYGTGSGSDRLIVELRIELQIRLCLCPGSLRSLSLPVPFLYGARGVVIRNSKSNWTSTTNPALTKCWVMEVRKSVQSRRIETGRWLVAHNR